MLLDALDPLNLRRRLERADVLRRAVLPLPLVDRSKGVDPNVFPAFESRPAKRLQGKRVGVVASAGSGDCVSLVGVARAFEEASVEPTAISACSGSALWGAMWAAGMTAQEMAEFSLSWRPQDHLDIQWTRLPRFALAAVRGYSGLAKGDALERLFDRRLWHMTAAETSVPFHALVYNLDRARVEYFGSEETPDLTLGEMARVAVALPQAVDAVRVEGDLYVDGAVVDAFPAEPLIRDGGFDHVFGLNVFLPSEVDGRGMRFAQQTELARRSEEALGGSLTLIEPIDDPEPRALDFYDLFLDRRDWPGLMRRGYEQATLALEAFA